MFKKYTKIILILLTAFIISDASIKNIFLANSPKIDPFFAQNMLAKAGNFWQSTSNFISFKKIFQPSNNSSQLASIGDKSNLPQNVLNMMNGSLNKVSQGVYAAERNNIEVIEVRTNEIDYLEYTFTVNGKEIKIKVPKDQTPPNQAQVEAIFK